MLAVAGIEPAAAMKDEKFLAGIQREQLENLAITEHLRWNAFHFAMGYEKMSADEVKLRHKQGITPIQKDLKALRHACLVSWNELDEISQLMTELTGRPVDYKEYDRMNVCNIPRTLRLVNKINDR
jgi:hypothetical protein